MRKTLFVGAALALSLSTVGCKSKEEQAVDLMEDMASVLEKNKDDCGKAGEAMEKWSKDNSGKLKDLKESTKGQSKEDEKKMMEKYKDRMEKVMATVLAVSLKCMDNEKFKKSMESSKL